MSRIGKVPITAPKGVTVTIDGRNVSAKGPKGEMHFVLNDMISAEMEGESISVTPADKSREARAMWGMNRTMVANLIEGVSTGFTKNLELVGVGYRAQAQGKVLNLQLGYSHDIAFDVPDGIEIKTPKPTEIEISGIDKQKVGQTAAVIRAMRLPEPYKGKGVRYAGEYIFRKEGKKK
ncbi:MAG: 50S ribosomal protein L6 [Pseudomonadota bacterium]